MEFGLFCHFEGAVGVWVAAPNRSQNPVNFFNSISILSFPTYLKKNLIDFANLCEDVN